MEKEQPRETVLAVEVEEEFENKERGEGGVGFEDYTEQPVLSPTIEEASPTLVRAEERGKRRAEE